MFTIAITIEIAFAKDYCNPGDPKIGNSEIPKSLDSRKGPEFPRTNLDPYN